MHLALDRTMVLLMALLFFGRFAVVPVQANIGPRPSTSLSNSPSRGVTSGCNPKKKKGCDEEDSEFDGDQEFRTPSLSPTDGLVPSKLPLVTAPALAPQIPSTAPFTNNSANQSNVPAMPSATNTPPPTIPSNTTKAPNNASINDTCKTDNGSFGLLDELPSVVTFFYAVELRSNLSASMIESNVLPVLETLFNDFLLPTLFPNQCSQTDTQGTWVSESPRATVRGLSAQPRDTIQPNKGCPAKTTVNSTESQYCHGVWGRLSLFRSNYGRFLQVEPDLKLVRDTLQEGMDAGIFNNATPQVIRVLYVPETEGANVVGSGSGDTTVGGARIGGIVAAAAAVIIIGGVLVIRKRASKREAEELALSEINTGFPSLDSTTFAQDEGAEAPRT